MSNIAHHTSNGRKFMIVQVPKGSYDHSVIPHENGMGATLDYFKFQTTSVGEIELPSGNYKIIFLAETATHEQAAEVVEGMDEPTGGDDYQDYYRNYEGSQLPEDFPWFAGDEIKSLQSLIRNLFPDNYQQFNHLIIEQL